MSASPSRWSSQPAICRESLAVLHCTAPYDRPAQCQPFECRHASETKKVYNKQAVHSSPSLVAHTA